MKRWFLLVALAIAVLAGGAYFYRQQIGERLYARAAAQVMAAQSATASPDGLQIYLCGTGSPLPDPERAGPCLGVVAGESAYIFDVGSGGMRVLMRMGFPIERLDRIYLTHLHSDHFDGLGEAMLQAWIGGARSTPIPVSGPVGVQEVVAGFNAAYRIDSSYRIAHHGAAIANPSGYGAVGEPIATPATQEPIVLVRTPDLVITAVLVDHAPVAPAYGYRIDYKGRSVSISGDTTRSDAFIALSASVDVMVHEALNPRLATMLGAAARDAGRNNLAQVFHDIQSYHTSPEDAARVAEAARARMLILTHITPVLPNALLNAAFIGDASSLYSGPLHIGQDGDLFTLPAGSDEIHRSPP